MSPKKVDLMGLLSGTLTFTMESPGQRIRHVRKLLNLTQTEFGDALNSSKRYISRLETDAQSLSRQMARKIAQTFSLVSEVWLLYGQGETPQNVPSKSPQREQKSLPNKTLTPSEREEARQIEQALQSAPPEILEAMRVLGEYAIDDLPPERLAAASPEARAVIERMRYEIYEQSEQEKIERMQREIAELRRENARLKRDRKDN